MVVHNYKRLWTRLEKENNYEFGAMYCAVHGYEKFKTQGENYLFIFNLTITLFAKKSVEMCWNFWTMSGSFGSEWLRSTKEDSRTSPNYGNQWLTKLRWKKWSKLPLQFSRFFKSVICILISYFWDDDNGYFCKRFPHLAEGVFDQVDEQRFFLIWRFFQNFLYYFF